jgi:formylglycine-generating enzyme required for sulfatase activity/tRNA A-37 threonylcarbamoyl transferase component Bud32
MTDWIGKTIGRVRIEKLLARGGMAEVYLGTHLTLERPVAIKLLQSHIEEDPDLLERFHREAKVVAGLRHSNIVQIYDFDAIDGHPYIVMEYLRGPTLARYLRSLHEHKERIPFQEVSRLLTTLTSALDYAHGQGVIHRDIKPGNIMLLKKTGDILPDQPLAEDVEIILTDFGLVRIAHATSHTAAGTVSGTPAYMSPEQARGDKTDHRTDIYSLGIVLYEMLAGRVPFEADSQLTVIFMHINNAPPPIPNITEEMQAVIDRALAKDPNERYQSSGEMSADFARAVKKKMDAEAAVATRVVPHEHPDAAVKEVREAKEVQEAPVKQERAVKPARSRTWLGVGVFAVLCLLALGAGLWGWTNFRPSSPPPVKADPSTPTEAAIATTTMPVPVTGGLPDGTGMVKVSGGSYEVGLNPADQYHNSVQAIELKDFWIDQFQVNNDQYAKFMAATNAPAPEVWPGAKDHPVRGVSWEQAAAYCIWLNKRLPTEAEWEAAGRGAGADPPLYPWGSDPSASGQTAGFPDEDTYASGTLSFNKSPFEVYDMVGNVWEWVGEPYTNAPNGTKYIHGGRFGLPIVDLAYRLAITPGDNRYIKYAGFRCAADAVK